MRLDVQKRGVELLRLVPGAASQSSAPAFATTRWLLFSLGGALDIGASDFAHGSICASR
jgi:hypothetical protein